MELEWPIEPQWRYLKNLGVNKDIASGKVDTLIRLLTLLSGKQTALGERGIEIYDPETARAVCDIYCPMAQGRLRLEWSCTPAGLSPKLVLDRKQYDKYDRVVWQPVLDMDFIENEFPSIMSSGKKVALPFTDHNETDLENIVYRIAASMVYALINGPIL
jgi:hypothetical protein